MDSHDQVGQHARCVRELVEARDRTRSLIGSLEPAALLGPKLPIVNPPLWELGHLGWFQERWLLRLRADASLAPSCMPDADALYDSAKVDHASRWQLPLPSLDATWAFVDRISGMVIERLANADDRALLHAAQVAALHEQMHAEAFSYSRQTLGYPAAPESATTDAGVPGEDEGTCSPLSAIADIEVAGGLFMLGADPGDGFVFDNEKWGHRVRVQPFSIARDATTSGAFAAFVDAGGYADRRWWCDVGWQWRERQRANAPVYWRPMQSRQGWEQRCNDRWEPIAADMPILHVNAFEAAAWCRWAGRRLPLEVEWEFAAATSPAGTGADSLAGLLAKRHFPWGDAVAGASRANLWRVGSATVARPVAVSALPAGDSAHGCRQMLGNVWEWTASEFEPYPGFVADPYREYSEPWFGTYQVLRGGCFATAASLIRNSWRNFYTPDRRDVYAGFRSCARVSR